MTDRPGHRPRPGAGRAEGRRAGSSAGSRSRPAAPPAARPEAAFRPCERWYRALRAGLDRRMGLVVHRGRQSRARPSRLWDEIPAAPTLRLLQSPALPAALKPRQASVTVRAMSPRAPGHVSPCAASPAARRTRRLRRLAGLTVVVVVARRHAARDRVRASARRDGRESRPGARRPPPPGRPARAARSSRRSGALRLQLPVEQSRVTAIGYHAAGDGALALARSAAAGEPGPARPAHRTASSAAATASLPWYQLPRRRRARDVGARRRRCTGHRRLLARRRHDRRHHAVRAQRRGATARASTSSRSRHRRSSSRSRACAGSRRSRSARRSRRRLEGRRRCSTSRASSGRRSRGTRTTRATT